MNFKKIIAYGDSWTVGEGWNQKKVVDLGNNSFEGLPYYPVTDQFEEGGS